MSGNIPLLVVFTSEPPLATMHLPGRRCRHVPPDPGAEAGPRQIKRRKGMNRVRLVGCLATDVEVKEVGEDSKVSSSSWPLIGTPKRRTLHFCDMLFDPGLTDP